MMWVLWVGLLSFLTKFQWTYTPGFDCHNFYKWSNRAFRQFVNHCLFNLKFHIRICEIFIIMYLGTRPVSESIQWDFFFFFSNVVSENRIFTEQSMVTIILRPRSEYLVWGCHWRTQIYLVIVCKFILWLCTKLQQML